MTHEILRFLTIFVAAFIAFGLVLLGGEGVYRLFGVGGALAYTFGFCAAIAYTTFHWI